MEFNPIHAVNALLFSMIGIVIFIGAFVFLDRMTPYDLWKEVVEHKNLALAVLLGSMSIGLCIIIAAAVH